MNGEEESKLCLDYLIQTKTPKIVTLETSRTQQDINYFLNIMRGVNKSIEAEAFYPNPSNFMCSENGCGYYWICKKEYGI